jgi:Protein of unknown function (DUF4230)
VEAEGPARQDHRENIERFIGKNPTQWTEQQLQTVGEKGHAAREPNASTRQPWHGQPMITAHSVCLLRFGNEFNNGYSRLRWGRRLSIVRHGPGQTQQTPMNPDADKPPVSTTPESGRLAQPGSSTWPAVFRILAIGAVLVGIILSITYAYHRLWHAPEEAAVQFGRSVASGLKEFFHFNPQVTVNEVVIVEASVPIFELATVSQEINVEYNYQNTQFLSEKSLGLRGKFLAKAGFDLSSHCRLQVAPHSRKLVAIFPEPKVLSVELKDQVIERSENGWWNRLSPADQKQALDEMQQVARGRAQGLLREAKANLENKVREIVAGNGGTVEFRYERIK